jgi:hypothetical protein
MGDGKRSKKKMIGGARVLVIGRETTRLEGGGIPVFSGTPNSEKRLMKL